MEGSSVIWLKIVSYLDPYSVCRMARTCTWAYDLVDQNIKRLPRIEAEIRHPEKYGSKKEETFHTRLPCTYGPGARKNCMDYSWLAPSQMKFIGTFRIIFYKDNECESSVDHVVSFALATNGAIYGCELHSTECSFHVEFLPKEAFLGRIDILRRAANQFCEHGLQERSLVDVFQLFNMPHPLMSLRSKKRTTVGEVIEFLKAFVTRPIGSSSVKLYLPFAGKKNSFGFSNAELIFWEGARESGLLELCTERGVTLDAFQESTVHWIVLTREYRKLLTLLVQMN